MHQVVLDQEELLKITWKSLQMFFWYADFNGGG